MGDVIPIHSRRTFTREEAERLLPVVRRITESAAARARSLTDELGFVPREEALHERLKGEIDLTVRRWAIKVSQLGCAPRGVWLVDFDSGNGWFSWRLGDEELSYFHPYESSGPDLLQGEERTPLA